jgi:predicted HTH transcriptional regulator
MQSYDFLTEFTEFSEWNWGNSVNSVENMPRVRRSLENLRSLNHVARNPLIVQSLSRLGYMRDFGTGIPRVIRLMREHNGTEPEFALIGEAFVARLYSPAQR